jgi:hypothetical protein
MGANLKQAQQQQQQQQHPTLALNDYQQNALMVLQYLNQKHQQEQLVKQDLFRQDELNAAQLLLNFSKASSAPQISFSNQQTKLNTPVTPSSMMNTTNSNEIKKPEEQNRKILKPHPKFRVKVSFIYLFFQLC